MRKNLQLPLRLISLTSEDKAGAAPPPGMVARSPALRPHLVRGGAHRHMRLQETAHPVDRALLQLRGFLPRVHRDLGVRRQRGDVDRGLQRMSRRVVWQERTKSRDTLYKKSGWTRKRLWRYASMVSMFRSGRRASSSGAQLLRPP